MNKTDVCTCVFDGAQGKDGYNLKHAGSEQSVSLLHTRQLL